MREYESILHALESHAESIPEKTAIIEAGSGRECTYAELWGHVKSFAKKLKAVGVKPASGDVDDTAGVKAGTRVVVRCTQTIDYMVAILAIHLSGGVAVPVEKNNADARIIEIMEDTESEIYIASKPLSGYDAVFIPLSSATSESGTGADENLEYPAPDSLAVILFTTGTTGKSKGVMHSHRTNTAHFLQVYHTFDHSSEQVWLIPSPLSHVNGLYRAYVSLFTGCTLVLLDGYGMPKPFFDAVSKYNVTIITLLAAATEIYLRTSRDKLEKINGQIQYVSIGASSFSGGQLASLRTIFSKGKVMHNYGSTEISGCYINRSDGEYSTLCLGRPYLGSEIGFFDEQKINKIEATQKNPGLIAIKSNAKLLGYWKNPELTKSVTNGEYFILSDLGYKGEDGLYYLVGRADDIIISGSYKIAPLEIEEVANSCPGIRESACVGVSDPIMGAVPKLHVVMQENHPFDFAEIYNYLKSKLESIRIPRYIEEIDEIPKINNKINRKELKNK